MGGLFSAIFGANELENVELSWDSPIELDSALYNETNQLLERCTEMQGEIDNYTGGKTEISAAMSASLDECGPPTRLAFDLVAKNAAMCLAWMDTANIISQHLREHILPHLKTPVPVTNAANNDESKEDNTNENNNNTDNTLTESSLLGHGALCKQLCLLFDFMFSFDQKKMVTSQIQNDFAFYKRTLSKTQESYMKGSDITVNSEKAGFISMFLAHGNPLVREISNQLQKNEHLDVLATFCNTLLDLLKANKFKNDTKTARMVVRAMLVAFILYDHASDQGSFHRRSGVKAQKICVMIVREYEEIYGVKEDVENLDNSLRYSTLHFNDDNTPGSIRRLLAVN